ncbi:queuine tRNA-ribosyltransferase, putative, partial [Hepatocystis sp. ex Piliocolobus tephrosceles]
MEKMESDLVNKKKNIIPSKNPPKSDICIDNSFEESNQKKKRRKKKKNDDSISNTSNDICFEKSKYEEPIMFDFLTEQDYNNYNKCESFFKNNFENIDLKNINKVITKLRNGKENTYLSNYVSSSESEDGGGDVTKCNDNCNGDNCNGD